MNNLFMTLLIIVILFASCGKSSKDKTVERLMNLESEVVFSNDVQIKFIKALEVSDFKQLDELLLKDIDVNMTGNKNKITPLFWSILKQNLAGFHYLLTKGADPNAYLKNDTNTQEADLSIMHLCAIDKNPKYLELALKYKGDPNIPDRYHLSTVSMEAIMHDRNENLLLLITSGADVNFKRSNSTTLIDDAFAIKKFHSIYILLVNGADQFSINNLLDNFIYFGDAGLNKKSEEYQWFLKVIEELRSRGYEVKVKERKRN